MWVFLTGGAIRSASASVEKDVDLSMVGPPKTAD
jgi:hypothetical protein